MHDRRFARKFSPPTGPRTITSGHEEFIGLSDTAALLQALRELPDMRDLQAGDLAAMTAKGVHHAHYRVRGKGLALRVPLQTPWSGDAATQLAGEAAAFERAAPSDATPRLAAMLRPTPILPRGALLVEEIVGRVPRLPQDLPAIADALARLHGLRLPPTQERPPLPDHGELGPVLETLRFIMDQRTFIPAVPLALATRDALNNEFAWVQRYGFGLGEEPQPLALVGTDTHPGNFVIRPDGSAVLVDLERVCYGSPAIDLAHATLLTSTTWDLEVQAVLERADVEGFYRRYLGAVGTERAAALRPTLLPARRLTWLRTMMWAVRWRALAERNGLAIDPQLAGHIRRRLDDFFAPATVARVRAEWLQEPPLRI
ncbi:MAG TPA: aminoglycoside phosphotransferase family protein [Stellaceae bacterium]|nr:aminoglycoside phosphotransferase family protein [Stellaceae bacterium]